MPEKSHGSFLLSSTLYCSYRVCLNILDNIKLTLNIKSLYSLLYITGIFFLMSLGAAITSYMEKLPLYFQINVKFLNDITIIQVTSCTSF